MFNKKGIKATLVTCSLALVVWLLNSLGAPLLANRTQGVIDNSKENQKRIQHMWNTLQQDNEISDPENKGADSDSSLAVKQLSNIEKSIHSALWDKHVKGTENDFEKFLDKVEVVVKINHRPTYDLLAYNEIVNNLIANSEVTKTWEANELPIELLGVAHEVVSANTENDNVSLYPFSMINKWNFQNSEKANGSSELAIDLSSPKIQNILKKIASETGSKELLSLAGKKKGVLFPTFEKNSNYYKCFTQETGLVHIDVQQDFCKPFAQKYMAAVKASVAVGKKLNQTCKSDLISVNGAFNLDPCEDREGLYANGLCVRSIEAYIRKTHINPNQLDLTHRRYLLENCQDDIKNLKGPDRELFDNVKN